MAKRNILKGLDRAKREQVVTTDLKALGATKFDIEVSPQARAIIANYGESFPWEKFKAWFLRKHMVVHGGHLHEYFRKRDGFQMDVE